MGRFWLDDNFIDACPKGVSATARLVYVGLTRHVNKDGFTFIGDRVLAIKLGLNHKTVNKCFRELETYHLLVRYPDQRMGRAYQKKLLRVPNKDPTTPHLVVPKVLLKEDFKEVKISDSEVEYNGRERMLRAKEETIKRIREEATIKGQKIQD
ncbi:hypothetical protein HYV73_03175 [Candidatus Uhrbacteria bacterium]|nr:hypothetical protein [Candidatus Uhrbacteria bacterium]